MSDYPLIKVPPLYPGQWGIFGSDTALGIRLLPGAKVLFVSSTHVMANNSNDGTDPNHPVAQLAAAVVKAAVDDWIVIAPKHAESLAVASAVELNLAGLHVVGVGEGADRPTFTMTAVGATFVFTAASCHLENVLFICTAASTIVLDVNGPSSTIKNVEVQEGAAATFVTAIDITGAAPNATDRTKVLGCKIVSNQVGATQGINVGAVNEGMQIVGNWIQGDFSGAGINSGSIFTNALIANNYVANMQAADFAIELTAAATGFLIGNQLYTNALATNLDPGSMKCLENFASISINTSSTPIPAAATAPLPAGSINAATFAADAIDATAIANGAIDLATFAAGALGTSILPVERAIAKVNGTVPGVVENLFTIAGGPIRVTSFVGIVTTLIGGASNCHIDMLVTEPAATVALSTNVALSLTAGSSITFSAAVPSVLLPTAAGVIGGIVDPGWLCPIGTIQSHTSAAQVGVIAWYMFYKPLSPLSVVTAV